MRFSLRGILTLVLLVAISGGAYRNVVSPVVAETALIDQLRELGADVSSVSPVPKKLAPIAHRERLERAVAIDLNTPQATIVFLRSGHSFPRLQSLSLVGWKIDAEELGQIVRREGLRRIELDSTAVTNDQLKVFQFLHDDLRIEQTHQWAHDRINSVGSWPWNSINNPLDVLQIVNHLRSIGKGAAIETLQAYVDKHDHREQTRIRRIIPMVFERIDPAEKLPVHARTTVVASPESAAGNLNELLDLLESEDHGFWNLPPKHERPKDDDYYLARKSWTPWRDVYFAGNLGFYITGYRQGGYSLPAPTTSDYLIKWASERGRLIDKPARPVHDPRKLAEELLKRFQFQENATSLRLQIASQQIDAQIDAMVGHLNGPIRWNHEMQWYEPR